MELQNRRYLAPRTLISLFVVLAGFYWLGNWSASLYDRDEPRFAQPAKEFLFAKTWKDWVVPHFNGEPFFHKPPLSYWQMTLAYKIFGVGDFSSRFFSGLWTALTAVILANWLAKRFSNTVGLVGAMTFSTSVIVVTEAKLATADATLGLLSMLAVLGLWDVYRGSAGRYTKAMIWTATGLAILCKGPTIFIILVGLVLALPIFDKNRSWILRTGFWWGIPLALAIGLPWYILANMYGEGGVVSRFVLYDLVARVLRPLESHRGFPGFYIVTGLIDAWPWSGFLIPVAIFAWRNRKEPAVKFLLAWLIGPTVILEFVQTKMVHYWVTILPAYTVLFSMAVDCWIGESETPVWKKWNTPVMLTVAGVWVAILIASVVVLYVLHGVITPGMFMLGVVILVSITFILIAWRRKDLSYAVMTLFMTMIFIVSTLSTLILPEMEFLKLGRQLARTLKHQGNDQTTYAMINWQEPSTVFYLNPGDKPVIHASADDFSELIKKPNILIALSQKGFNQLTDAQKNSHQFYVLDGYDYTRGRKGKIYITGTVPANSK